MSPPPSTSLSAKNLRGLAGLISDLSAAVLDGSVAVVRRPEPVNRPGPYGPSESGVDQLADILATHDPSHIPQAVAEAMCGKIPLRLPREAMRAQGRSLDG